MNDIEDKYTLNVDVSNVSRNVQKYTETHENANECIEKPKMLENFKDGKMSNISADSDNFKVDQRQKADVQSNFEGGDELSPNHENNLHFEMIKKEFEGLKIRNELITDKVQKIDEINKLSNDQITTIKTDMNKIQNEMETMHGGKITKALENAALFKVIVDKMSQVHSHIDQFTVVVNGLKLEVKDACENKETITEIMEVSEYLRTHYVLQMTENQKYFTEQMNKHVSEIDQLKAYWDNKVKEVDTLEGRANDQKLCIDSNKKSTKHIADKISNFFSYIKQLQNENDQLAVPNENQKDFFLLLAEQLEEINELLETHKKQDIL